MRCDHGSRSISTTIAALTRLPHAGIQQPAQGIGDNPAASGQTAGVRAGSARLAVGTAPLLTHRGATAIFPPCIQRSCLCQAGCAVCPVLAQSITLTPAPLILCRASRHRTTMMTRSMQRRRRSAPNGDAFSTPSLVGIAWPPKRIMRDVREAESILRYVISLLFATLMMPECAAADAGRVRRGP